MGVSKVNFGSETIIDLTEDTVSPENLIDGITAHDKAGNKILGILKKTEISKTISASSTDEEVPSSKCVYDAIQSKKGTANGVATLDTNAKIPLTQIPDEIARTSQIPSPVQSDYNQNNDTQPDYIKNRTHYKEIIHQERVDLLPATEICDSLAGEISYSQSEPLNIQAGDVVKVLWDNQEYERVAQSIATLDPNGNTGLPADGIVFGNLYYAFEADPDSQNIPFLVIANYTLSEQEGFVSGCTIMPTREITNLITVNIFTGGDKVVYHKLDVNYLNLSSSVSQNDNNPVTGDAVYDAIQSAIGNAPVFEYLTEETTEEIPCTGLTLEPDILSFSGSGQQTIVATALPTDTTDPVIWLSSDKNVATVSNGIVTAVGNGDCTITATCGSQSASCSVNVSGISTVVSVTGVTLDKATASVDVGSTVILTATIEPSNASNQNISWSSDNETVATVENGTVIGVSAGTATIGVMTEDGGYSAVCNITVNEAVITTYKNLFDKDTMVTANQGITGTGVIGSYAWGLARVPVQENSQYSYKAVEDYAANEANYYGGASAGCIGFADSNGEIISRLSFALTQDKLNAAANGENCLLKDYTHGKIAEGSAKGFGWVTFTTPAGCAYLLFNTTLKNNADKIQLEAGDTIHNYYLPYSGGVE